MRYFVIVVAWCLTGLSKAKLISQIRDSTTSNLWKRGFEDDLNGMIVPRARPPLSQVEGDRSTRRSTRNIGVNRGGVQNAGHQASRQQASAGTGSGAGGGSTGSASRAIVSRTRTRPASSRDENGGANRGLRAGPSNGPRSGTSSGRNLRSRRSRNRDGDTDTGRRRRDSHNRRGDRSSPSTPTDQASNVVPNPRGNNLTPIYNEFARFANQAAANGETAVAHALVHTRGNINSILENHPPVPDDMWSTRTSPGNINYRSIASQGKATTQAVAGRNGGLALSASATKRVTALLHTEGTPGIIRFSGTAGRNHKLRVPANAFGQVDVRTLDPTTGASASVYCEGKSCGQVQAFGQNNW